MARVFEVDLGKEALRAFRPLTDKHIGRRLQARMARRMRDAFFTELRRAIVNARRDGTLPYRTGRGYSAMLRGIRVFGSSFATLRGHIIGPDYMAMQEKGAEIVPINAEALAIPILDGLRPDGTAKLPGPNSWRIRRSFIYKSKRTGQAYIARRNANGDLSILYVLVDMVEVKKNIGFMRKAFEARKVPLLQEWGSIFLQEISRIDIDKTYVEPATRRGRS